MSADTILQSWKKAEFAPVYWLQGEEDYYNDLIMNYAEHHILSAAEAEFNLTVFYGRDADWASVENACKSYPMFGEKRIVLLKEAQHMKDIDKLENYISAPLASTCLVVAYKGKSFDKRQKFFKKLQEKAVIFNSDKIKEGKLGEWIRDIAKQKGYSMDAKALQLMEDHIGNDLSRLANEIEKLSINLKEKKTIDADDIEKYIGISKEYNIFELQKAIAFKDFEKALRTIRYFESNPKASPIQMALPALYGSFSRMYAAFSLSDQSPNGLKPLFYYNYYQAVDAKKAMDNYGYAGIEKILLLLHEYNLKSVGIRDVGTPGATLLKEMVLKIMQL